MTYSTLSPKYQVVIPKEVRRRVRLKPGEQFVVWTKGGVIYLIPRLKLKAIEGIFKGLDVRNIRDEGERA